MSDNPFVAGDELSARDRDMLDTLLTPPRKRMPLSYFEKNFLPFLSSVPISPEVVKAMLDRMSKQTGAKHTVQDLIGNMLNEWTEYHVSIGAPYQECDIVIGDEVVYVVPPILENKDVISDAVDSRTMCNMAIHAGMLSTVSAGDAGRYIVNNILPLIVKPNPNPKYIEMWNRIYEYHGLPLIHLVDGVIKPINPVEVADSNTTPKTSQNPFKRETNTHVDTEPDEFE